MSISGIYLPISIHTLYHSLVLSLSLVHEITYFHHTLHLLNIRPLRSTASHQLLAPAGPSLYIPCSFTAGDMPAGNCPWPHCRRAFVYMGTCRRAGWTQRLRTGTSPTCPTSFAGGTVRTSVRRSNNLPF